MIRLVLVILLAFHFPPFSAFAVDQPQQENPLIAVCFYVNQLEAVRVDLERFAHYRQGSPGFWEEETKKALERLSRIRTQAERLPFPESVAGLQRDFFVYSNALEAYVRKFREGFPENVRVYEDLLQIKRTALRENLLDVLATGMAALPRDCEIDPWDEELRLFPEGRLREDFLKGTALLEEKKYKEAAVVLEGVLAHSRGELWRGSVILRVVRAALRSQEGAVVPAIEREGIDRLAGFIDEGIYSPLLVEIFLFWRLLYQGFYYGWDKKANIPNGFYQEYSERVAQTLRQYIALHPLDGWARQQLVFLATASVFSRGTDDFFLML